MRQPLPTILVPFTINHHAYTWTVEQRGRPGSQILALKTISSFQEKTLGFQCGATSQLFPPWYKSGFTGTPIEDRLTSWRLKAWDMSLDIEIPSGYEFSEFRP